MNFIRACLLAAAFAGLGSPIGAEQVEVTNGGDTFVSGPVINDAISAAGDAFAAARTVNAKGSVAGDLHAIGIDVTIDANTSQDLYAIGASVTVQNQTSQDLTIAGMSVRLDEMSRTEGNARLLGRTITVDGPISGALLATGQDVIVNSTVGGDARILARSISFGPNARVAGTLTYSSAEEITVPQRVAPAERVVFNELPDWETWGKWDEWEEWEEWGKIQKEMPVLPTFASLFFGFAVTLLFYIVVGAVMLGFMPRRLDKLRESVANAPGQSMLLGIVGLSMLFGLVPITAMTIVGLPFVPIVILSIIVAWIFGYALGVYSVAMRIWTGFGGQQDAGNFARLLVFAVAITVIALLNFIPFLGWVINYSVVLLGIGAITRAVLQAIIGDPGEAFDIDMKPIETENSN